MKSKKSHTPHPLQQIGVSLAHKLHTFLSSNYFFISILVIFTLQLLWVAIFAIYPALFDEEYHLGIIDIYARNGGLFITSQPPEAAFHGDITRYGSYLFHYIMSFPYQFISFFIDDLQTKIILLRIICITFVLSGVVMWRIVLLRMGVSRVISHVAIFVFTMVPLVSLAFAQLNYDALAFLIVPVLFYCVLRITDTEKNTPHLQWLVWLLTISAFGVLVKFTLLPIVAVCVVFALIMFYVQHKKNLKKTVTIVPKPLFIVSLFILVVGIGLFTERYGVNIAQYKAVEPKCDQVHSRESCFQYTVYRRDTTWRENNDKIDKKRDSPYIYTKEYWAPHIFNDFFVTGALVYDQDQPLKIRYLPQKIEANGGNMFLRQISKAIFIFTIFLVLLRIPYLWKHYRTLFILTLCVVVIYMTSLWVRNYTDYLKIGTETAAQGRYVLPLLIPMFGVALVSLRSIVKKIEHKTIIFLVGMMILSQGGGVTTYILKSNEKWYWVEQRTTISAVNQKARQFLSLFIRS